MKNHVHQMVVIEQLIGIRNIGCFSGIGRSRSDFRSSKQFCVINSTVIQSMVR